MTIDFIDPIDTDLDDQVVEAHTEEQFAAALNASIRTGVPIAVSYDLAERFGLIDPTDRSAEYADFFPAVR